MLDSSSYKKVRVISEGNFHSCYASNKAEKFKFCRMSQGLESCAQAQSLKLRKEEKELKKSFHNLEKEKERHTNQREQQKLYLQHADSASVDKTFNSSKSKHVLPHTGSNGQNKLQHTSISNISLGINEKGSMAKWSKMRTSQHTKSLHAKYDSDDVIPFYMRHSYDHYHDDERTSYDNINKNARHSSHNSLESYSDDQLPSWMKDTNLTRLKYRRQTAEPITADQLASLQSLARIGMNKSENKNGVVANESSVVFNAKSEKSMLKVLHNNNDMSLNCMKASFNTAPSKSSCTTAPSKQLSTKRLPEIAPSQHHYAIEKPCNSVLTPMERKELLKHHCSSRSFLPQSELFKSSTTLTNNKPYAHDEGRVHRNSNHHNVINSKLNRVKILLAKKLQAGESLADIAKDERFDDLLDLIDDGITYSAYVPGMNLQSNYRALWKCKYLRLSKLNLQSLKEATLASLIQENKRVKVDVIQNYFRSLAD